MIGKKNVRKKFQVNILDNKIMDRNNFYNSPRLLPHQVCSQIGKISWKMEHSLISDDIFFSRF